MSSLEPHQEAEMKRRVAKFMTQSVKKAKERKESMPTPLRATQSAPTRPPRPAPSDGILKKIGKDMTEEEKEQVNSYLKSEGGFTDAELHTSYKTKNAWARKVKAGETRKDIQADIAARKGKTPKLSTTTSELMDRSALAESPSVVHNVLERLEGRAHKGDITEGELLPMSEQLQANYGKAEARKNEMRSDMTSLQFIRDSVPSGAVPALDLLMRSAATATGNALPTGGVYASRIDIPRSGLTVHRQRTALNGLTAMVQKQHDHWTKFSRHQSRY